MRSSGKESSTIPQALALCKLFRQETALSRIFRCLRIPNTEKVSRKRPSLQEAAGC